MTGKAVTAVMVTAYLTFVTVAVGAPPEGADPKLAPWFRSLQAPNGSACCEIADCRRTAFRLTAVGYEAMIEDQWVAVPWERVLRRTDNPTGEAIVCYVPHTQLILCFVRPPDS